MPPTNGWTLHRRLPIIGLLAVLLSIISTLLVLPQSAAAETTRQENVGLRQATFTDSQAATKNFDRVAPMSLNQSRFATYLSFRAPTLARGESIAGARLTLYVESANSSAAGLTVRATTQDWNATKLTYDTRPGVSGVLGRSGGLTQGRYLSITLDAAAAASYITKDASFRLTHDANTLVKLSRSGVTSPVLKLTISSGASEAVAPPTTSTPTATPSATPTATASGTANGKLVFAHYFPAYPISIDNKAPAADYYTMNYLNPNGENGKFKAVGGILRDRPIPRDPISASNYRLEDLKTEVRQAADAGIDGFAVDVLSLSGQNWDQTVSLMNAATAVSSSFRVMLQPDMTSSTGNATASALADKMATLGSYKSAYRVSGKLVVSPYKGEAKSVAWWKEFMSVMKSKHGIEVAFMPVFLDVKQMSTYSSISYGFGEWGARNPASVNNGADQAANAHKLNKKWIAPVAVQDFRPVGKSWEEAGNTETLRASWQRAIKDDADYVLLTTWNDYSETTTFAPSIQHGFSFLDVSKYYATQFKTDRAPSISNDTLVLTHRTHIYSLKPTQQTTLATLRSSATPARNTVEVLSFLTSPATVTISVGGTKTTYTAPAGVSAKTVALKAGSVSASATRNGGTIATVATSESVVGSVTVQDLGYHGATSARTLPRQS